MLKKIIIPFCVFKPESDIKNLNFKNRYGELQNMIRCCINVWNDIIYAWSKTQARESDCDPRFYYQTIIFNLYMLSAVTRRIESDVLENNESLKNMRDNIAHMDEKLKKPLNFVRVNDVKEGAVFKNEKGGKTYTYSLNGLFINTNNDTVATPLGVIDNTILSTLQPSEQSTYDKFVSYEISEPHLLEVQDDLLKLLKKYLSKIE